MEQLKKISLALVIGLVTLATAACPDRVSIADLERNPSKYQNKDVVVAGTVRDSYGLSIPGTKIGGGAYKIDDGTGSILVIVSDGGVPNRGSEIGVKGRFGSGISWNGRTYGIGIYEKDRRYRTR